METVYAIGALRVSSDKQSLIGDSPEDQKKQIELRAVQVSNTLGIKIVIKKWFEFIESASGELEVQPVQKAISFCKNNEGKYKYFFFKSIDRFTRGGSTIYGLLTMQLAKYGVHTIDTLGVISNQQVNTLGHLDVEFSWSKFNPSWITELLESERYKAELRDILTRMIGAEINYVRMGYRARGAPAGYMNEKIDTPHGKRVILVPHPVESPWFVSMFEFRAQGMKDEKICEEINKMGFETRTQKLRDKGDKQKVIGYRGGKPLNVKQLQRYVRNPIYAGVNNEKWTNGKPVKCQFEGLVSYGLFNRANRGKISIAEENGQIIITKGKTPEWLLVRQKDNPDYAYKNEVLCQDCGKTLLGSAPRSKSGKHSPRYHCGGTKSRDHNYWSVNKKEFDRTIKAFVKKIVFQESSLIKFRRIVLEEWNKREKQTIAVKHTFEEQLKRIDGELQATKEKLKALSSITAIKMIEEDIEELQQKRELLTSRRNNKEKQVLDIETAINRAVYYMEHLDELLFSGSEPLRDSAMFGLLFEEKPFYEDLVNGTPKLAPIFGLKEELETSQTQIVTPPGVEPGFLG